LFEDPVAISNGHTYDREALTSFVEAHRLPQEDGEDGVGQDGVPLEFLDTPLPCHASVVKSAESSGHAQGGGQGVTAFMKEQVYPNLLAVAAVDEFNAQVGVHSVKTVNLSLRDWLSYFFILFYRRKTWMDDMDVKGATHARC